MEKLLAFFLSSLAISSVLTEQCDKQQNNTLEFLFMTSFAGSFNSSGNAIGMEIALEKINSDPNILPNYTLTYSEIIDTQCNRSISLKKFFQSIQDPCRRFIAVVGSGCSVATEPVAEILHYWGLTQLSYVSNAIGLSDVRNFPQYIQLYPSEANLAPGIAFGIQSFGWTQIVAITERDLLFMSNLILLRESLTPLNVRILETPSIDSLTTNITGIKELFPPTGRIYFVNTYEDKARLIMCEAYHKGLYGPNYLWLVFGWYSMDWWKIEDPNVSPRCTPDNLYAVLDHAISILQLPVNYNNDKTVIGNISYDEYYEEVAERNKEYHYNDVPTSHIAYDTIWTLALALDRVDRQLKSGEYNDTNCTGLPILDSLTNWTYSRNTTSSCLIYNALLETEFEGLSGNVGLNMNGTRLPVPLRFFQYRNEVPVLVVQPQGLQLDYVEGESRETLFPDGVPHDGTPIVVVTTYHPALVSIVYILATIGLVYTGICFVFLIVYRKSKVIELSTNMLNYCLLVGVSLLFTSLYFRVYSTTNPDIILGLCYVALWLLGIGYIISFGSILTKMGRIYYVFFYPSKDKIKLTNIHLLSIVAVLTSVMALILLIGSVIPYSRLRTFLADDIEQDNRPNKEGVLQMFHYYRCYHSNTTIWLLVIFLYLIVLQVSAIVLVIQTRNIKIKVLNDSKPVAVIIYVLTVVIVVFAIVAFAFRGYHNLSEALFSSALLLASYTFLICIFTPLMYLVYKDPTALKMLGSSKAKATVRLDRKGVLIVETDKDRIKSLYREVDHLEKSIEDRKVKKKY